MIEKRINEIFNAATEEQLTKYGCPAGSVKIQVNHTRTGGIQVNIQALKNGYTNEQGSVVMYNDELKSRVLLTVAEILREGGFQVGEVDVSHGGKRTFQTVNGPVTVYSCWPSLFINQESAAATAARSEASELKQEMAQMKADMAAQAAGTNQQFAAIMALLQQNNTVSAENSGTPLP